jgi:hypothetical protein
MAQERLLRIAGHDAKAWYWKTRITHRKSSNKGGFIVTTKTIVLFLSVFLSVPSLVLADAVSEKDYRAETTQDLMNLCTAPPDDPLYLQAINFCHGYLVGAYAYYEAASSGPKGTKLVCPPEPRPTRNETLKMFIDWVKAHPQHLKEKPVETEFRFLMEKWPCKP